MVIVHKALWQLVVSQFFIFDFVKSYDSIVIPIKLINVTNIKFTLLTILKISNIWNTLNAPAMPFYCVHKITFCAPSGHKNTLCLIQ